MAEQCLPVYAHVQLSGSFARVSVVGEVAVATTDDTALSTLSDRADASPRGLRQSSLNEYNEDV